jgi:hypothetical protein
MFLSLATFTVDAVVVVDIVEAVEGDVVEAVEGDVVEVAAGAVAVVAVVAVEAVSASDKSCGMLHLKQEGQMYNLTQLGKVIVLCAFWKFWHSRDNFLPGEGKLFLLKLTCLLKKK